MDFTADKLRSLVRKWQTLIEAHVDIKTTDGYLLRMFCIGFTKKRQGQVKKTCYAQTAQIRQIRKKMMEIMIRESTACDLKDLVSKFIPEAIGAPGLPVLHVWELQDTCQFLSATMKRSHADTSCGGYLHAQRQQLMQYLPVWHEHCPLTPVPDVQARTSRRTAKASTLCKACTSARSRCCGRPSST